MIRESEAIKILPRHLSLERLKIHDQIAKAQPNNGMRQRQGTGIEERSAVQRPLFEIQHDNVVVIPAVRNLDFFGDSVAVQIAFSPRFPYFETLERTRTFQGIGTAGINFPSHPRFRHFIISGFRGQFVNKNL